MLIQSSFKDYYDSAASSGIDKAIVYKRETAQLQLEQGFFIEGMPQHFPDDFEDEEFTKGRSHPDREYCKWMIIGFCGKYYLSVLNTLAENEKKHSIAYYGDEILALNWQKPKSFWRYEHPKKVIEQMLHQWHLKKDGDLFFKLNSPVFVKEIQHSLSKYELKNKPLYLNQFEINPNLNNYQFYKMQDVFSAFQSIQSYISGVLGTTENDMIELSNNSKIIKAGFDVKTSFRKSKRK